MRESCPANGSVLVLPDGRTIEHPEPVARGDLVELEEGCLYFVEAAAAGTKRATGEAVTLARLSAVRD